MDDHDHMESLSCLTRGEIFDCKGIGQKLLYVLLVKRNMEESFFFLFFF